MKSRLILTVVGLALTAIAGAAFAAPDAVHALLAGLTDPHSAVAILAFGPMVRALQAKQSDAVKAMGEINARAEADDRDLTADEQTKFAALKTEKEGLSARIARAQDLELADAQMGAVANIVAGILGAFVGGFLSSMLGIGAQGPGFHIGQLLFGVIGACIVIGVYKAISGPRPVAR